MDAGPHAAILLRRDLAHLPAAHPLPDGLAYAAFGAADFADLHALLAEAYTNGFGHIADLATWRAALLADSEFDSALVFLVRDTRGDLVAAAQCWTSDFVKDFAVRAGWRGRGVGDALLGRVLEAFAARKATYVSLKVMAGNVAARRLYARAGFAAD